MTNEEHLKWHQEAHKAFDYLLADYIENHPDERNFLQMPLINLMQWSFEQTTSPHPLPAKQDA